MTQQFDQIADFVMRPQVPQRARRMAALLLVDTLGVAAGAHTLAPSSIARDYAVDFHGTSYAANSARLLFDGRRAAIPGAAFAAATQIDNLDGHDGYNPTKGHIGCAVVPALLAFAEQHPELSSTAALDILAMSYEVGARAAVALHDTVSDYHTSGAWNGIAVAAIGCALNGASKEQLRHAVGIAEYHGPRSQMMREIANPTMLHDGSGMGALTGAMAAILALRGFEGAPAITLEAPEVAAFWEDLGARWTIELNYIKPYPVCRWAHAPLDALLALMTDHALRTDDILRVDVNTFTQSAALFPGVPETTGQAQYSLAFALASMMHHGHVGPAQISGAGLSDAAVAALLPRITVHEAQKHSDRFPARRCADISITLTDGRVLDSGDTEARGGPEAPLREDEVEAKLHLFAAPTLGDRRTNTLWRMREELLDPAQKFTQLLDLVTTPV
ncbi:MAG: MmgE/PrpD family protein [Roseobacter sp.]